MKKTLARTTVTAALAVALAAGVGAGTASAAPAVAPAPAPTPSYCKVLTKLEQRYPRLHTKLPAAVRDALTLRCPPQVPVQDDGNPV